MNIDQFFRIIEWINENGIAASIFATFIWSLPKLITICHRLRKWYFRKDDIDYIYGTWWVYRFTRDSEDDIRCFNHKWTLKRNRRAIFNPFADSHIIRVDEGDHDRQKFLSNYGYKCRVIHIDQLELTVQIHGIGHPQRSYVSFYPRRLDFGIEKSAKMFGLGIGTDLQFATCSRIYLARRKHISNDEAGRIIHEETDKFKKGGQPLLWYPRIELKDKITTVPAHPDGHDTNILRSIKDELLDKINQVNKNMYLLNPPGGPMPRVGW